MNPFLYTFSTKDVRKKLFRLCTFASTHAKTNNTHGSYGNLIWPSIYLEFPKVSKVTHVFFQIIDANVMLGKGGGGTSATNSLINDTGLGARVNWDDSNQSGYNKRSRENVRLQNLTNNGLEGHEEIFPN